MKEVEQPRPLTLKTRLQAGLVSALVKLLCSTVRIRFEREREYDRMAQQYGGVILVCWHGRTMMPLYHFQRQRKKYYALVSLSRDGDLLSEVFRLFGFQTIRGSTRRRGIAAAREAISCLGRNEKTALLLTPDGPRGPRGVAQAGVCYIARHSGKPIIPCGISADPCWHASTWDNYLIPKPFSRGRIVGGDPIFVRREDDIEAVRQHLEDELNRLEKVAEEVAHNGQPDPEIASVENR
ncbi:MAG: lysophospholipid acyltransferase family protein [Armatimonadaceae bacterium]